MTVGEVLANFREALRAVTPMMEIAGIPWRRPDAYDAWDSVATALFETLVVAVLKSSPGGDDEELVFPGYDMLLDSYRGLSTLEVEHSSLGAGRWVFHAFGTQKTPFDTVEVRAVSVDGVCLGKDLTRCPFEGVVFSLRLVK